MRKMRKCVQLTLISGALSSRSIAFFSSVDIRNGVLVCVAHDRFGITADLKKEGQHNRLAPSEIVLPLMVAGAAMATAASRVNRAMVNFMATDAERNIVWVDRRQLNGNGWRECDED